jgi:signal transduction histidine kinase
VRIRTYALLLLVSASVLLLVFGYVALERAERTAVDEVRTGTERVADTIALRIAAHIESERTLLRTLGAAVLLGKTPDLATNAFSIQFPYLHDITVYGTDGARIADQDFSNPDDDHRMVAARAIAGESAAAPVRPASASASGPFAHTVTVGEPVWIAGERVGAVVARIDLVGIWKPINQARVGRSGFIRLLAGDGTLLAHGDPEERREVFGSRDHVQLVAGARARATIPNAQGVEVFAAVAEVGERGWMVIVEQPAAEALGAVRVMRRDFYALVGATLLLAVGAALVAGRKAVRGIERLEAHTHVLASGDLDAVVRTRSRIAEIDGLERGVNEMASSLKRLHHDARERERLTTFGRVAAGLSHDLKQPLEHVRTACEELAHDRDSPDSWELFDWMRRSELPRLVRFLEDLKRLAIEGRAKLHIDSVDPDHLLAELTESLRGSPKWSRVEFSHSSSAPRFHGDENLLRRALYNLAANAADACSETEGRSGTVKLEATEVAGEITIRVCDTGPGIPPAVIDRIMHGDFHSTKRTNGIGLGLGVARHVVQMHGGRIEVASEVGAGTTFTLTLPEEMGSEDEAGATGVDVAHH